MTRILVFWVSFCAEIITSAFANTKNAPSVELHLHEEDIKQDASTRYLWFYVEALSIRFFDNFCKQSIKTFESFNPCSFLPSIATDRDRKQFQSLNIVLNNKTGSLLLKLKWTRKKGLAFWKEIKYPDRALFRLGDYNVTHRVRCSDLNNIARYLSWLLTQELLDRIRLKSKILKMYDFTLKALGRYSLEQKLTKNGRGPVWFHNRILESKID